MAEKLQKLRLGLIDGCTIPLVSALLDDLLDEGILNDAEVEYIEEKYDLCRDKMRILVATVKKKGDPSSEFLIQKVSKRDPMLSKKLGITAVLPLSTQEQNASTSSLSATFEFPWARQAKKTATKTDIYGIMLCSDEDLKRITWLEEENIYPIRRPEERTRLALIICNQKFDEYCLKERRGAEFDVLGMTSLLTGLGYKVQVKQNLTVEEMRNTLKTFAQEEDHKTSDSTFIVIMSHGLRDHIMGTDTRYIRNEDPDKVLHIDEVFNTFNNVNCHALENKPKVVIIQSGRQNKEGNLFVNESTSADSRNYIMLNGKRRKVQRERDFVCFCSTTPDSFCWRDPRRGSLFILSLIEHMKTEAYRYSIGDIFQHVQRSFMDKEQMPTLERTTLLKKFYLFPGH